MQSIINKLRNAEPMQRFGWISIGVIAVFIVSLMIAGIAKAEGVAKKKAPSKAAAQAEDVIKLPKASKSFAGVGLGAHTSWQAGALDLGGPINLGVEGPTLGVSAIALAQIQQFVAGVEVSYNHYFGDPRTIGGNYDMAATVIGGVAMGNLLPYLHASPFIRMETDAGKADGYGYGAGLMLRTEGSKMIWDVRAERRNFEDFLGSGADVHVNSVRFGGKYLFQTPQ